MNAKNIIWMILPLAYSISCADTLGKQRNPAYGTEENRAEVMAKIEQAPWAAETYKSIKTEVDTYILNHKTDPHWLSSRLFMHWESRATTTLILNRRWAGAEGRAPVPTPHFDGARDWNTDYQAPGISKLRPYNEQDGKIWLEKKTGGGAWVNPGQSGEIINNTNAAIMKVAANAAFLYWLTKNEDYAHMAADVLWTYAKGFSHVTEPKYIKRDKDLAQAQWLGATSFEVIRERVLPQMALAFDYLYPYLITKREYDVDLIQNQMKRIADRIIAGGSRINNWNIKQNYLITHLSRVLENDEAFADKKGRQYYTNIILYANLPAQTGVALTLNDRRYEMNSNIWPEAPGYSFDTTRDIIRIGCLLMPDAGKAVPLSKLADLFFAQKALLYPDGWSAGIGDTVRRRIDPASAEYLLAVAASEKNTAIAGKLADFLRNEINLGVYKRNSNDPVMALMHYVADVESFASKEAHDLNLDRMNYINDLSLLIQRNPAKDKTSALAASMYGSTSSGHLHYNGLSLELFGQGMVMGADPGAGESYWAQEHKDYYRQAPAHNTVIPNGGKLARWMPMSVKFSEPAFGAAGLSPNICVAQATLDCTITEPATLNENGDLKQRGPISVAQKRTVALIRTGTSGGFCLDIFRSKNVKPQDEFQDYIYHNVGNSMVYLDRENKPIHLSPSKSLSAAKNGYQYFNAVMSAESNNDMHGIFAVKMPDMTNRGMSMWLCGSSAKRQMFSAQAPACYSIKNSLPGLSGRSMPTAIIRQFGEAWDAPFVVAFEPKASLSNISSGITSFQRISMAKADPSTVACAVEGKESLRQPYKVYIFQSENMNDRQRLDDLTWFSGGFGVAIIKNEQMEEIYLVNGKEFCSNMLGVSSGDNESMNASVRKVTAHSWSYSATRTTRVSVPFYPVLEAADYSKCKLSLEVDGATSHIDDMSWKKTTGANGQIIWTATCMLPKAFEAIIKQVQ